MDIVNRICPACGATLEDLALNCHQCGELWRAPNPKEDFRRSIAKMIIIPIVGGAIFVAFINFPWEFTLAFSVCLVVWIITRRAAPDDDRPDDPSDDVLDVEED